MRLIPVVSIGLLLIVCHGCGNPSSGGEVEQPFPQGHGGFIETEGGIYAQFGDGTVWWIHLKAK